MRAASTSCVRAVNPDRQWEYHRGWCRLRLERSAGEEVRDLVERPVLEADQSPVKGGGQSISELGFVGSGEQIEIGNQYPLGAKLLRHGEHQRRFS